MAFHFLRPWWLLSLPLIAGVIWLLLRRDGAHRSPWQAVCDPALLDALLIGCDAPRRNRWMALLGAGLLLAAIALAGPAWHRLPQPLFRQQQALVILLDLSRSMLAGDLKPNRLTRAKEKLTDLLARRKEGETALIVYAAEPFVVVPLTDDTRVIAQQLPVLRPEMMPAQGSRLDLALDKAQQLLANGGVAHGQVVVLTDSAESGAKAAARLRRHGHRVSLLGFGTRDGAPIPGEGGFVTDAGGNIVIARSDWSAMERISRAGGGLFARATLDDRDLDRLTPLLAPRHDAQPRPKARQALGDRWREEGVWLLPPLLLLAALAFRRGWLLTLLMVLMLPPQPASAMERSDWWRNRDQQGMALLEQGRAKEAAGRFLDRRWRAVAHYRAGEFAAAARALDHPATADDWYNRGNALAKAGHLAQAIAAYDQALKLAPDMEDAAFNRALVRRLLRRNQTESAQGGSRNNKGDAHQQQSQRQRHAEANRPGRQPKQSDRDKGDTGQQSKPQRSVRQGGQKDQQKPTQHAGQSLKKEQHDAQAAQQRSRPEQRDKNRPADARQAHTMAGEQPQQPSATPDHRAEALRRLEQQQARRMWLRRVPDDPGGLLRRKFHYQYRRRVHHQETTPW
ncbi:MAG: VWA domain-containing protein [Zetaproteobacteria bacterium]|nr:MAG: VWA domain-containing protein [Zetaproteobacteria bacterium]